MQICCHDFAALLFFPTFGSFNMRYDESQKLVEDRYKGRMAKEEARHKEEDQRIRIFI